MSPSVGRVALVSLGVPALAHSHALAAQRVVAVRLMCGQAGPAAGGRRGCRAAPRDPRGGRTCCPHGQRQWECLQPLLHQDPYTPTLPCTQREPWVRPPRSPTSQLKPPGSGLAAQRVCDTTFGRRGLLLCSSCGSTPEMGSVGNTAVAGDHAHQAAKVSTGSTGGTARGVAALGKGIRRRTRDGSDEAEQ